MLGAQLKISEPGSKALWRQRLVLLTGFLLLLPLASACGKKTGLVPPQAVIPAAIEDLRYSFNDSGVILSWTFPRQSEKGLRLDRIEGFEILRAVIPAADYCASCPVTFGPPLPLAGGEMLPGTGRKQGRYFEPLTQQNHYHIYAVRSQAGFHLVSRDSNTVAFLWDTQPAPPEALRATSGDTVVNLSWQASSRLLDNRPLNGPLAYQVWRRAGNGEFRPIGAATTDLAFTDPALRNNETYWYRVQAFRLGQQAVAGKNSLSEAVEASPRDLTPPPPPRELKAVRTAAGVQLVWDSVLNADLGGYRLYRRLPAEKKPQLLSEIQAPQVMFIDRQLPAAGSTWYYSVSAFDRTGPPNESPLSSEIEYHYERF